MTELVNLSEIESVCLSGGTHKSIADGACVMEAVSFVAGEPWSDSPVCACPVISALLRVWNDDLSDSDCNVLLRPLIPRLVGTRSDEAMEQRRAMMAADWLIRVYTPTWLRLAKLEVQADALASLQEITGIAQFSSLMPMLETARREARVVLAKDVVFVLDEAAWKAAWKAAWAAVGNAVWTAAAWAADWPTVGNAVWYVALNAAKAVALDAATGLAVTSEATVTAAALDAARNALKPTSQFLQQSALVLVNRMIDARGLSVPAVMS